MSLYAPQYYYNYYSQNYFNSNKHQGYYQNDKEYFRRQPSTPSYYASQARYQTSFFANPGFLQTAFNQYGVPGAAVVPPYRYDNHYRSQYTWPYINKVNNSQWRFQDSAFPLSSYSTSYRPANNSGPVYQFEREIRYFPYPVYGDPGMSNFGSNRRTKYTKQSRFPYTNWNSSNYTNYQNVNQLPPKIRVIFIPPSQLCPQQPCNAAPSMPPFFFNRMSQPLCSLPLPPPLPQISSLSLPSSLQQQIIQQYSNRVAVLPYTSNYSLPPIFPQQQQQPSMMPMSALPSFQYAPQPYATSVPPVNYAPMPPSQCAPQPCATSVPPANYAPMPPSQCAPQPCTTSVPPVNYAPMPSSQCAPQPCTTSVPPVNYAPMPPSQCAPQPCTTSVPPANSFAMPPSQWAPQPYTAPVPTPNNIPVAPSQPYYSNPYPSACPPSNNSYPSTCRACIPAPPPLNVPVTGHCWVQHCSACHHVPADVSNPNVRPQNHGRMTPLLRQPTVAQYVPDTKYQHQHYPHVNTNTGHNTWSNNLPPLPPGAVIISDEYITRNELGEAQHYAQQRPIEQPRVGNSVVRSESFSTPSTNQSNSRNSKNKTQSLTNKNNSNPRTPPYRKKGRKKRTPPHSYASKDHSSLGSSTISIPKRSNNPAGPTVASYASDRERNLAKKHLTAMARMINLRYHHQTPDIQAIYHSNEQSKSSDDDSASILTSISKSSLFLQKRNHSDNQSRTVSFVSREENDEKSIQNRSVTSSKSKQRPAGRRQLSRNSSMTTSMMSVNTYSANTIEDCDSISPFKTT